MSKKFSLSKLKAGKHWKGKQLSNLQPIVVPDVFLNFITQMLNGT